MDKKKILQLFSMVVLIIFFLCGCGYIISFHNNKKEGSVQILQEPRIVDIILKGKAVYSVTLQLEPEISQIYTKDLETGIEKQLTFSGSNSHPVWSPDGSKILYLSWSEETSFDINIMDEDGKNSYPIINSSVSETNANWSPDGKRILYTAEVEKGYYRIFVLNLNDNSINQLTHDPYIAFGSHWSSDGTKIAFISKSRITDPSYTLKIFIMDSNGSNIFQLTKDDDYSDSSPIWCPDDTCILFLRPFFTETKIMKFDLTTGEITQVFKNIFLSRESEFDMNRSLGSSPITFSVENSYYVYNIETNQVIPMEISAEFLSFYPEN